MGDIFWIFKNCSQTVLDWEIIVDEEFMKLGFSGELENAKCKMQNAKSENGGTMREIVCKNDFSIGDNHFWSVE